ncbi:MAG: hypothetical protein HRT88_00140 [Lentisphaeraceae bacterium]|nr:hypothetical protein [Lentisphaeraceae bacterium]
MRAELQENRGQELESGSVFIKLREVFKTADQWNTWKRNNCDSCIRGYDLEKNNWECSLEKSLDWTYAGVEDSVFSKEVLQGMKYKECTNCGTCTLKRETTGQRSFQYKSESSVVTF